jgi:hypothetical protein
VASQELLRSLDFDSILRPAVAASGQLGKVSAKISPMVKLLQPAGRPNTAQDSGSADSEVVLAVGNIFGSAVDSMKRAAVPEQHSADSHWIVMQILKDALEVVLEGMDKKKEIPDQLSLLQ